jgi:hypothetical protein
MQPDFVRAFLPELAKAEARHAAMAAAGAGEVAAPTNEAPNQGEQEVKVKKTRRQG